MAFQKEKHYRVIELSRLLNLSDDKVRDLFENEPGVLAVNKPKRGRRRYRLLLIPESVVTRVLGQYAIS